MIAELTPKGWLNARLADWLRCEIRAAVARGCTTLLISGSQLRYQEPTGLALLAEVLAETRQRWPRVTLWLCHLAPDLLEALHLADIGEDWRIAPDQRMALAALNVEEEVLLHVA